MGLLDKFKKLFSRKNQKALPSAVSNETSNKKKSAFDEKLKFDKENLLKPENITTDNVVANMLMYLGVGPSLAQNPIVKKEVADILKSNSSFYILKDEQYFLEHLPSEVENFIKKLNVSSNFDQNSILINFDGNRDSYDKLFINLNENGTLTTSYERRLTGSPLDYTSKTYNQFNVLVERHSNNGFIHEHVLRNSENPFIFTDKLSGTIGYFLPEKADHLRNIMDLSSHYLCTGGYMTSDESFEDFRTRIEPISKAILEKYRETLQSSHPNFLKYIDKYFPELSEGIAQEQ